jgi:hypothetical protein
MGRVDVVPKARAATNASTVGYSGKALWQKLGLKPGLRVWLRGAPADYWAMCGFKPDEITLVSSKARSMNFGHVFATRRSELERDVLLAARKLEAGGMLWISWPKKTSGVASDLTEGTLREVGLPLGLVDVKVCAVTDVWSGLKFVWRLVGRSSGT